MPDAGDETLAQKLGFTAEDSAPEPTRHDPPPSPPAEARGGKSARSSRLARRRRVLLAVGAAAVLLSVGGLIGAAFVKSPAQLAADTAPPANTVTTAKVTSQVLTSSVAMRGGVYPSTQYDIAASGPASQLYISRLGVTTGTVVQNGQFLAEIDGEPMFALAGAVPAWRTLMPGESGPDVAELQKALAALGYGDGGDTSGYLGAGTKDAVSAYYDHLGYTAPTTGAATQQAVNQAQKAVTSDQQQIAQLEAKPQNSQTKAQLDAAEKQLTTDESALSAAEAVNGPEVPQGNVVFLPTLPSTVVTVNGAVGQQAGSPFLELSARSALALTGELPPSYASQVRAGLTNIPVSRLAARDASAEAVAGIVQRPGRSALTMLGTVLGVGAFVTVLGLTATAAGQVSRQFTVLDATTVTVEDNGPADDTSTPGTNPPIGFPADADAVAGRIDGVVAAGVWWPVSLPNGTDFTSSPDLSAAAVQNLNLLAVSPGAVTAMGLRMAAGSPLTRYENDTSQHVAMIDTATAQELGISPGRLASQPALFIDGVPYTIVGVYRTAQRMVTNESAVLIPENTALADYGNPEPGIGNQNEAQMVIATKLGAAKAVGRQIAAAELPTDPKRLVVTTPPNPQTLQSQVSGDLTGLFLVLASISLLIGAVGIANTTLVAVPGPGLFASVGVGTPPGQGFASLPAAAQKAAGKCATIVMKFSNAQLSGSLAGIQTLANDIYNDVLHHPAVQSATKAWSACMAKNGYDYPDPMTAFRKQLFSFAINSSNGKVGSNGSFTITAVGARSQQNNKAQIAAAVTDADCTQSTDLAGIYFAVQASYEQQIVDLNQEQLNSAVDQYRAAYHKELGKLSSLLTTTPTTSPFIARPAKVPTATPTPQPTGS